MSCSDPKSTDAAYIFSEDAPEAIQHVTAGCKMLAVRAYMERHNKVAGIVHRNIFVLHSSMAWKS